MVARQLTPPLREGLYVSPAYVERHGLPQSPQELSQHRLIGYRFVTARRILPLILNDQGHELTIHMPSSVVVNDIEVMADAVRRGLTCSVRTSRASSAGETPQVCHCSGRCSFAS